MEDPFFWKDREINELKYQLEVLKEYYRAKLIVYSIVCFILGLVIAL